MVSDLVLSEPEWEERYEARAKEKLKTFLEKDVYKVNGVFNEELLVKSLRAQLYNVTCENNTYGPTYDNEGKIEEAKELFSQTKNLLG